MPSNAMLRGDFSYLLTPEGGNIQLRDPQGGPYPNNLVDPANFSPVVLNLMEHISRSDDPAGLVRLVGQVQNNNTYEFTIKADFHANDNNHISFRSFFIDYDRPAYDGGGNYNFADRSAIAQGQNHALNWTWTVRPTLVNNLVFGYNRNNSSSLPSIHETDSSLGAKIPSPEPSTIGGFLTTGFNIIQIPVIQERHNWIISDTVSWTKGKHLIAAGVNVLTQYSLEQASWLADPIISFDGSITGSFYSDLLLGYISQYQQGGGEFNLYSGKQFSGFAQDTIRLKPNLNLTVGIRWEPYVAPKASRARTSIFLPGKQSTRYPNAPVGLVYPGDAGVPEGNWFSNWYGIAPRLGLAWQPSSLPNTSIRAAFGIFMVPYDYSYYNHIGSTAPFSPTYTIRSIDVAPTILRIDDPWAGYTPTGGQAPFPPFALSNFVPDSNVAFTLPVSVPATFDPNFKIGKDQSWNLSIEHQFHQDILVRAAYVGREAYHLTTPLELNPGFFSAAGDRLRYPSFSQVLSHQSSSTASYNALQLTVEKRFSHGVQFTSNYTYSKGIDTSSLGSLSNTGSVGNPFDLQWNRGISGLNFPLIWSNFWVWQLPSLKQSGVWLRSVLGDWQISGIWSIQSGRPFSISGGFGNNQSLAGVNADRADLTGEPFLVRQGPKSQWLNEYFNRAAFQPNAPALSVTHHETFPRDRAPITWT